MPKGKGYSNKKRIKDAVTKAVKGFGKMAAITAAKGAEAANRGIHAAAKANAEYAESIKKDRRKKRKK